MTSSLAFPDAFSFLTICFQAPMAIQDGAVCVANAAVEVYFIGAFRRLAVGFDPIRRDTLHN